jgi:catechol 2,3-dioxygenase-like lactoylglutathione lyase family enzyme
LQTFNTTTRKDLDSLDHTAIAVRDLDETVDWYLENFACRVLYRDATWALLEFANSRLAFVLPDQHPPHVAVRKLDAERFGVLGTHRDGTRFTYVTDPSGNTVEILAADGEDEKDGLRSDQSSPGEKGTQ